MERSTLPRGRQPCATAHPGPRHRRQRDRPRRQVRQPDRHQGPASRPRIAAALPWCSCCFLSWPFSSRPASPKMPPAPNVRPERRCAWAWICRSGHHVQADRSPGIWHDRNGSGLWHWPAGPDHRLRPGSWAPVWPALVLGHADAAAAWRSVVPERRWSFQLFCLKDPRGKKYPVPGRGRHRPFGPGHEVHPILLAVLVVLKSADPVPQDLVAALSGLSGRSMITVISAPGVQTALRGRLAPGPGLSAWL